jgi:hypothetical protein
MKIDEKKCIHYKACRYWFIIYDEKCRKEQCDYYKEIKDGNDKGVSHNTPKLNEE